MRVVVAGSSGLIGTSLVSHLREAGHDVLRLVRRAPAAPDERGWDPPAGRIDDGTFDGVDAVVNLNGVGIADRPWSGARKQLMRDSRNVPTEVLAAAVAEHGVPALLNALGRRLLRRHRSREVDETAPAGLGLPGRGLPGLGGGHRAGARAAGARVVLLRIGLGAVPGRRAARAAAAAVPAGSWAAGSAPASSTCRGSRWTTRSARSGSLPEHPDDRRPGQPDRPGAGHERRVHPGAGRRGRPARAVRGAGVRASRRCSGRWPTRWCSPDRGPCRQCCWPPATSSVTTRWARRSPPRRVSRLTGGPRRDRRRRRARRAARRRTAVHARARRGGAGRRRPAGRADGHRRRRRLPLRPRVSRCSTPPTRRCGPLPTSTRCALRPFEAGAAIRGADGGCTCSPTRCADPACSGGPRPTGCSPRWPRPGSWPGRRRCSATPPARTAQLIDRSAAQDLAAAGLDGPVMERLLRPFLSGVLGESALSDVGGVRAAGLAQLRAGHDRGPGRRDGRAAGPAGGRAPGRVLRLGQRVSAVRGRTVSAPTTGASPARAVLVATDPVTAAELLPGLDGARDARR